MIEKISKKIKEILDIILPPPQNPIPEDDNYQYALVAFLPAITAIIGAVGGAVAGYLASDRGCVVTETTTIKRDAKGNEISRKTVTEKKC